MLTLGMEFLGLIVAAGLGCVIGTIIGDRIDR